MGFAYYGTYLRWFEIGRTEYLRGLGVSYKEVEEAGVVYPVTEAFVKYHAPAVYDEVVEIVSRLAFIKKASLRFDYEIRGAEGGKLHATGWTVHAALDRTGRLIRISEELLLLLRKGSEPTQG